MNRKPHHIVATIVCLLFVAGLTFAQEKAKKPVIIQTESKVLTATLMIDKDTVIEVKGNAIFRLTSGHPDESLSGIFTFTFFDKERQRIAQAINERLDEVPTSLVQHDVLAQFQREIECPTIHLDFSAMDLPISKKKIHFNKFVLEFKFASESIEPEDYSQHATSLICRMAQRRKTGIYPMHFSLRRLNQLLHEGENN